MTFLLPALSRLSSGSTTTGSSTCPRTPPRARACSTRRSCSRSTRSSRSRPRCVRAGGGRPGRSPSQGPRAGPGRPSSEASLSASPPDTGETGRPARTVTHGGRGASRCPSRLHLSFLLPDLFAFAPDFLRRVPSPSPFFFLSSSSVLFLMLLSSSCFLRYVLSPCHFSDVLSDATGSAQLGCERGPVGVPFPRRRSVKMVTGASPPLSPAGGAGRVGSFCQCRWRSFSGL